MYMHSTLSAVCCQCICWWLFVFWALPKCLTVQWVRPRKHVASPRIWRRTWETNLHPNHLFVIQDLKKENNTAGDFDCHSSYQWHWPAVQVAKGLLDKDIRWCCTGQANRKNRKSNEYTLRDRRDWLVLQRSNESARLELFAGEPKWWSYQQIFFHEIDLSVLRLRMEREARALRFPLGSVLYHFW